MVGLTGAYVPCVTSHLPMFPRVRLLECGPHIHGQLACVYATASPGSGAQKPGLESRLYHLFAVWLQASHLTSLGISVLIHKTQVIPTSKLVIN